MNFPNEVDIDNIYDRKHNGEDGRNFIKYLGKAKLQSNGKYKVLANVNDCLCLVEVDIIFNNGLYYGKI